MALFEYMQQVQRFLRDAKQELINPADIISYINRARRQIAFMTQCLRVTPPISGSVMNITVTAPGSGYTAPVLEITPPDFPSGTLPDPNGAQATGTATQIGGAISAVNLDYGGAGYFQPIATISDPTGSGAELSVSVSTINILNQGQEEYFFRDIDTSTFPGVGEVYAVISNTIIYSNYRYSLPRYSYSTYLARIANYPFQYQWTPTMSAQRGQGTQGSFLFYPIASQPLQWQADCLCLPVDLENDIDYEALPSPWTDGIPYFAAHLAMVELQNWNAAAGYLAMFEKQTGLYSRAARPGHAVNPYGRF